MSADFQKSKYKNVSEVDVKNLIISNSFLPVKITNTSGYTYEPHQHPETKLLVILQGSMKVSVEGNDYDCEAGDQIIIPGDTIHSAVVGDNGCVFFWSEKRM
jgi:quercetin dioxygenase-like cupin family protein